MRSVVVILVAVVALAGGCGGREAVSPPANDALLIVSVPGLGWADVQRLDLDNIEAFAAEAAIGHVATRLGRRSAAIDAAYLTIGAGTRALAPPDGGGVAVEPSEELGGSAAKTIIERRTGKTPTGPAYINVAAAAERNSRSSFGATVGALGDSLEEAGVRRSVIANADTAMKGADDTALGRDAVGALMDADGFVDGGAVSPQLLEPAAESAWGVHLDADAVLAAFERAWTAGDQQVVLVEASDLRRASTYQRFAAPSQGSAMRDAALRRTDELLGRLLDAAGPSASVLVVSPVAPPGGTDLALAALRGPGIDKGMLRSATTRRDGYVQLADIAPTVLATLGLDVPEDAEGRPFTVASDDRTLEERADALVTAAEDSRFRDSNLAAVVTSIVLLLLCLTISAVVLWRVPRWVTPTRRRALRFASFLALGLVPATYLVQVFDAVPRPAVLYAVVAVAVAAAVAVVATIVDTRWRGAGVLVGVGAIVATIAVDVLVGAPLQVNAFFGYSLAVAGRFAGVGNLAFALLSAAALLFAVLVVQRLGARGRPVAIAVLVTVVLVDGLPMFGADVGGVLSMVPAFGIVAILLSGRRVRGVDVLALSAAAFAVLFAAAFIDSARAAEKRTHLARLADHLTDGRWDRLFDSLVRRWAASFGSGDLGAYVLLLLIAFVTASYVGVVAFRSRERHVGVGAWQRIASMPTALRAASIGLSVLALLGLVANDSSIAVPATMLIVIVPVAVERSLDGFAPEAT